MKKRLLMLSLAATLILNTEVISNAASLNGYYGYVKKTQDLVTEGVQKQTTAVGTNYVEHIEKDNVSFVCWIQGQNDAKRIMDKVSYGNNQQGKYVYMTYSSPVSAKGRYVSLAISTSLTSFTQSLTFGSWSPDDIK